MCGTTMPLLKRPRVPFMNQVNLEPRKLDHSAVESRDLKFGDVPREWSSG
jgi:hypothetical protein